MNSQRIVSAAKDCITQFLASRFPLKNVANDIIAQRKLNSRERRILFELVFRWCREINLVEEFLRTAIRFSNSMSAQAKNQLALEIFAHDLGLNIAKPDLSSMSEVYLAFLKSVGDQRYLCALHPFVRDRLVKEYGEGAAMIAKGLFMQPAKYVAFDPHKLTDSDVSAAFKEMGVDLFSHPRLSSALGTYDDFDLKALPQEVAQHVWVMDAGSQIIAEMMRPQPDHKLLDLCAGEGNKARYITRRDCHYVAADISEARLAHAKKRLEGPRVDFVVGDGRSLPLAPASFDWILLDAPCTGIGVLRRHPDLMFRIDKAMLDNCLSLQKDLLASAIKLLKPGGILIYATCSLFRAENGQQIESLLKDNKSIMPCSLREIESAQLKLDGDALDNNSLTLFPHIDDCDGFFVAVIKKKSSAN